jgi:hypothetical protein
MKWSFGRKSGIALMVLGLFGLTAFSVAQDSEAPALIKWICASGVPKDPRTQQALKLEVGTTTHEGVAHLMGKPWRVTNDADCEELQYSDIWEYLGEGANGTPFRLHVSFDKDGKVSLVARIPRGGKALVLAYADEKVHLH